MGMTMRVSLPGYNAGTDTNLDHFALYADADNVLIKEKTRGTMTTGTVGHGLSYIPLYMAYDYDGVFNTWVYGDNIYNATPRAYSTTSLIRITSGGTAQYFIFYDRQV